MPDGLLGDVVYTTFLKQTNGVWQVVSDLSRSDVPTAAEVREIRRNFPGGIPAAVVPDFWRKRLRP